MRASRTKASMKHTHARGLAFTGAIAASWIILQGLVVGTPALAQKGRNSLTYGELLQKIDQGKVTKVELDEAQQKAKVQLEGQKPDTPGQDVVLLDQTQS